jgi:hypothetical protein
VSVETVRRGEADVLRAHYGCMTAVRQGFVAVRQPYDGVRQSLFFGQNAALRLVLLSYAEQIRPICDQQITPLALAATTRPDCLRDPISRQSVRS